jgi:dihydrodipicolinate synthase/N-acetylneuraminate lyase
MPELFQAPTAPYILAGISGSLAALATPFRGNQIDDAALAELAERQIARGTAGLVVCGSTGEASALTPAEHEHVVHVVVDVAAGRVPVIAGWTSAARETSVALAETAAHARADGLLGSLLAVGNFHKRMFVCRRPTLHSSHSALGPPD